MFEHFGVNKDKDIENIEFNKAKKDAFNFIKRCTNGKEKNETPIDKSIKALIAKLNSLSFVYTTIGSCEGHSVSATDVIRRHPNSPIKNLRLPPEGFAKYFPGYFHLKIDWSSEGRIFIEDLKNIIQNFSDASIEEEFDSESGFVVYMDRSDKNGKYFPIDEAKQYETIGRELIKKVERLVDTYLGKVATFEKG